MLEGRSDPKNKPGTNLALWLTKEESPLQVARAAKSSAGCSLSARRSSLEGIQNARRWRRRGISFRRPWSTFWPQCSIDKVAKAAAELKVIMSDNLDRIAANAAAGISRNLGLVWGLSLGKEWKAETNPIEATRIKARIISNLR